MIQAGILFNRRKDRSTFNYFNKSTLTSFILLSFILSSAVLSAQPTLITPGADYDPYPITFTDDNQRIISIELTESVTVSSGTTGWTFMVGGVPVSAVGPSISGTSIRFQLASSITYADRLDVYVSYDGTGTITGTSSGLQLGSFTNYQAINNLKWDCSGLTGVQQIGTYSLKSCAPTEVELSIEYSVYPKARNSIYWDRLFARVNWGDPLNPVSTSYLMSEVGTAGSGNFRVVTSKFTYQVQDVCSFTQTAYPLFMPTNGYDYFGCALTSSRQTYVTPSYQLDNQFTGVLSIDPPIGDDRTEYCVGEDIVAFTFEDNTQFNCRFEVEEERPNANERWVQFIYGTGAGPTIPNVFIDVSGTLIQLTDDAGNPIAFPTATGLYEGPVQDYNTSPLPGDENSAYPDHSTYPIYHDGNFDTDAAGMIFEVTMREWGPCNPYDEFDISNRIEEVSHLILIESPPPPVSPDPVDCADAITDPIAVGNSGGIVRWYNDPDTLNLIYTGASYNHSETAPGTYSWWVTEKDGIGNGCISDTTRVTLIINEIPNKPTITASGPTDFCVDPGVLSVTLTADPEGSVIDHYQWYLDGVALGGETSNSITLSQISESGDYTVRTYGPAPTYCEGPLSDPTTVNISDYATTTDPADAAICGDDYFTNGTTSFSVTTGGPAHTIRWQRRISPADPWVDITAGDTPNDNCTYSTYTTDILNITSADYGMNGYQYRAVLNTVSGGCETTSAEATLTVYPVPAITTQPVNTEVCEYEDAYFSADASIAAGSITTWAWQRAVPAGTYTYIDAGTDGGTYTDFDTKNLTVNNPDRSFDTYRYRVVVTSDNGCTARTSVAVLNINPLADITTQPSDRETCSGLSTTFEVQTDGNPLVTNYQWQVSTDGGSSWNNATGGIYSGENSSVLTVTNIPIGSSGDMFKCILTTDGPCTIETNTPVLTVYPSPSASIAPASPGELCNGDIINFNGGPSGGTLPYTHSWTGDTGPLNATDIVGPTFTAPITASQVTYDLTYTVTDSRNCTASDDESVIVNPAVTVNVSASETEICVGATSSLDGNPAGGTGVITSAWTGTGSAFLSATNIADPVFTAPSVPVQTTYTLTYTAIDTKACESSQTINIIVNPLPTADIQPDAPGEMCFNTTQLFDGNADDGTAPYSHAWTGDVAPLDNTNIEKPVFTAPSVAIQTTYNMTYTVQDSKGCTANDAVAVVVNPEFQSAVLAGDASVCPGDYSDLTVTMTGGVSPYHVELTSPAFGAMTIDPYLSGDDINVGPHSLATNTFSIVAVSDSKGCAVTSPSGTATIIVGSLPTSALLVGGDEICEGETQPLQVNVTGGAPPYDITIDALGVINNYISGTDIPTGILAVGTHNFNLTSITDNCGSTISGAAVSGNNPQQIEVNPIPVLSTVNNTPEICNGGSTDIDLSSTVAGTVYSWTVDDGGGVTWTGGNSPSSGTATFVTGSESIIQTLQHSMSVPVDVEYTITSAGPSPTSCSGNTRVETVTVEPSVVVTADEKTICSGDNADIDVNTVCTGIYGVVYTWTVTPNADVEGEADGPAAGQSFADNISQSLTNNSDTPQTITYTIIGYTTDALGNLLCAGTPKIIDIIVEPKVTILASDVTICNNTGTGIDVNTPSTGSIGLKYVWTVTAHSDITGEADGPAAGVTFATDLDQTLLNGGDQARTATYTITGYTTDAGGNLVCAGTPKNVSVIVEPVVEVTASDKTICNNNSTDLDVNTIQSGSEGVRYTWTVSAPDLTGESDETLTGQDFATNLSQTLINGDINPHTAVYTITGYTTLSGNLNCPGTPEPVTITVEPDVIVSASDEHICSETATNIDVNTTNSGSVGVKYSWTVSAPVGISGASDGPATGQDFAANIVQTLVNSATSPQVVTYNITGYTTDAGGNLVCGGTSVPVYVTVEPKVKVTADNQLICDNVNINMDVNTVYTGVNGVLYSWTVSAPAEVSGTSDGPVNGQNFAINISQTLQNSTSFTAQTAVYSITGYTTDAGGLPECAGDTLDVSVIIEPVIEVTAGNKTICSSTSTDIDVNTLYSGSIDERYNWTVSAPALVSGASNGPVGGLDFGTNLSQTLINNSSSAQIVTYTIRGYSVDGSGNLHCPGPATTVQVTVEPYVVLSAANDALCFGETTDIDVNTTYTSTNSILYTWTVAAPGTVTGAADGPAAGQALNVNIQQTLENSSDVTENVIYTITPWTTDGGGALSCAGDDKLVTISANPKPVASPVNNSPIIPNGDATNIEMDGNVTGTTFGWRVINAGATGASNGSGLTIGETIAQTLTNTTGAPWTVIYRIGPSVNGCTGDSVDVSVQVDPAVDMTVINVKPDICTEDNTQIEISSNVTGATFTWTVDDPDGAGASTGTGVGPNTGIIIQDNLVNGGTSTISVTYHITPTGPATTFIVGTTQDVTVNVYPEPQALPVNNAPQICNGSSTDIYLDSDVAGTTFTWTVNDPTGGASGATASGAPLGTGQTIAQTLANSGNTSITIQYLITPVGPAAGSCPGDPVTVNVVVDPTPASTVSNLRPEICSNTETDIALTANVIGTTFDWHIADPKGTGAYDDSGVIGDRIQQTLINPTQSPVNINYEIMLTGPGITACPGATVYEAVQIDPLPNTTSISGKDTVCEQTTDVVFSVVPTNDSYYEWYLPATLGTRTLGGSGINGSGMVITAADIPGPAYVTDSIWVFETNKYGCTNDTVYHSLTLIPYPAISTINGDANVCAQTLHTYSVPDNAGSTYQWTVPIGAGVVTDPTLNTIDVLFGTLSGQIRVKETTAGGCVINHTPLDITVSPLPVTTLNADQTAICNGETVVFTAGPAGQLNYEFFLNGTSVQNGASDIYSSATLVNNDQLTVLVTSNTGCEKLSPPVLITVNPNPTVTLTSTDADNIICAGDPVTFDAVSDIATTYNFFRNGVSVKSGAQNFWTTTTLANGDAVYVTALSSFGCQGISDTITTTVNPLPAVELSGDNAICPGDVTPLTVSLTAGSVPFDVTIDNGVGTLTFASSPGIQNVSPATTTSYMISTVTDNNGCTSSYPSALITGSASIIVRDTVRIITNPHDAEICETYDTSFTVSATGDGLLYQWQYTDNLANPFINITGATANHSGYDQSTLDVIAANAALDGYYYRVIVSSSFCPEFAISDTVQLTLKYNPLPARNPFDQVICENSGTGFGVDAGLTANPLYQWQISYDNGTSWINLGDTAVYSGTHTDSLRIANATSRFNEYQYRVEINGDCGSPVPSASALLTILERPEIKSSPDPSAVCEGDATSFEVDAGDTDGATYRWQVNMNDGFGYVDIAADSAGIYNGWTSDELELLNPISRMNGYRYQVIVGGTCPSELSSSFATLTVYERPEISSQPSDTSICEGEDPFFIVNAGKTTNPVYQWQVSYNGGTTWLDLGDTAIYSGSNTSVLRLFNVPTTYNNLDYQVIISNTCGPVATSIPVHLTVNERPEILKNPADTTVCEGEPVLFTVDAGATYIAAYEWQVDMGSGFVTIGTDSAGIYSGYDTPALNLLNATSRFNGYRYQVIVSGACTSPVTSTTATLSINEKAEISQQPADQVICEDEDAFFIVRTGKTTAPVISWNYSTDGGLNWLAAAGLPEAGGTTDDTLSLYVVKTDYDQYLFRPTVSDQCGTAVDGIPARLTVYEKPQIDDQPDDVTACEQDTVSFIVNAGLTTDPLYQWQVFNGTSWTDVTGTRYQGVNDDTLIINGVISSMNNLQYRVLLKGYCVGEVKSDTVTLIVDKLAEIVDQPVDMSVCENDNTFFGVDAGYTTDPVYLWEYWDGSAWQTASMFTGWDSDTIYLTAVSNAWNNTDFKVTVSGKCGDPVESDTVNLTVKNRPVIEVQPSDTTTCEGVPASFTVDAGNTSNPEYFWEYNDGVNGWMAVSGAMYSGTGTNSLQINNPNSSMNGYIYKVTVDNNCGPSVPSIEVILTVNKNTEIFSQPESATICENADTSFMVNAGVTSNPQYEWSYNDGVNGWQIVSSDAVHVANGNEKLELISVPYTFDNYQYKVEVKGDCGSVTSDIVKLDVFKRPEITQQPKDTATCELLNVTFSVNTGLTYDPAIQWEENDLVNGWQSISDGGNFIGTNSTTLKIFGVKSSMTGYEYRAIVSGYCADTISSDPAELTVYSAPEIGTQPDDQIICEGEEATFSVSATGYDIHYEWFEDDGSGPVSITNGGIYSGQGTDSLTITGADRTLDMNRYYVKIDGECNTTQSEIAFLYISTPAEITYEPADTTVCEFATATFTVSATGDDLSYQWYESTDNGATFVPLSNGNPYFGVDMKTLYIFNVLRTYSTNLYHVEISGSCGNTTSADVELTVNTSPVITKQPETDVTVCDGEPATFSVEVEGSILGFQWQINKNDGLGYQDILVSDPGYTGQQSDELKLLSAQLSQNGYSYKCIITGNCNNAYSDPSILYINSAPTISVQPNGTEVCEGISTQFSASASGASLTYQWFVSTDGGSSFASISDGGIYTGTETDLLLINSTDLSMNGYLYKLEVSNACVTVPTNEVLLTVWENPEADIQGDNSIFQIICRNELVTLSGNASGGSGTYLSHNWTGDILPLYETNLEEVRFMTADKDVFNLTYTVTDDRGCKGHDTKSITTEGPDARFDRNPDRGCGELDVQFTNRSTADAINLTWDFDDGTFSNETNPLHGFVYEDPTGTGAIKYYMVNLIAESVNGCTDTATSSVTIYPEVDPSFTLTPSEGCSPLEVMFQTQPGADKYVWEFGDTEAENGQYIVYHTYENKTTEVKTYHARLTTTSSLGGCSASATMDVVVYPMPGVNFTATPQVQTYPDATVTFTNYTDAGSWSYLWKYGDGNTSDNSSTTHSYEYAQPGEYDIMLVVNTAECTDSMTKRIIINPQAPVALFTAPAEGCHPLDIKFVNNSLYASSFQWQFGDGTISTQENPVHIYYEPAEYTVKLIASGPGGTSMASTKINVHATPQVFFNYFPDSVYVNDAAVRFFNLTAWAESYIWNFGDIDETTRVEADDNISTEAEPEHIYHTEGWKDVKLVASNEYCIDSLLIPMAIKVTPAGELKFPNIFSPVENSDGTVDPTGGNINTVFYPAVNRQVSEYHLYIYNRWGELIFESTDINIGWDGYYKDMKASQGVYIWKVTGIYTNGKPFSEAGDVTLVWR